MEIGGKERFEMRKLEASDKSKGFIELLQQLSVCDSVSDEEFKERFEEISMNGENHMIYVIEDEEKKKIIASGCLFIEKKFLRNCGKVGHIEDIVVDSEARGLKLGQKVVEFLSEKARSMGCYKVILDCDEKNVGFYEKCGFQQKGIEMALYF
ncbi:hypothetical protein MKW94_006945 [Papaver nudicaule]|uniref:Glucosamine 6-phosphate N-acetyltransferase n=1 Tax=Papaver nudicaule TaxID=74823 RepID=A0AA41VRT4_PAPNU|nr:hypothetical protein [Papaver nudicaule]